ncbi:hypothetical protein DV735_g1306, partial [Chaetothyriales sp. CBS 134920]
MAPQPSAHTAPATLSQPSRKGKKAWRKNVDISEVTTGIEALREEIRTTGGPIAEQTDDQLFTADTAGDEEIKRRHKLTKPLKVDQILAQRSAVPIVDGRKRKSSVLGDGIYESSSSKRRKEGWVAKKEIQRLRTKINSQNLLDADHQGGVGGATIRRAPIPMTASGKPAKAVASPDEGTSYNPAFEAWAALIAREGEKEVAAEEARLAKAQADAERQARIDEIAAKPDNDGGYDTGAESAWEGFDSDGAAADGGIKKKRPGRKTPQQRKRAERRKEQERLAKHEAAMGRRKGQMEQAIMALIKAQKMNENADLVVLPEELQDSLRRLKPEGNLMTDRFRTLLVNGKLEARKRILQPRKRKVKVTEKWSYKDFELPGIKA